MKKILMALVVATLFCIPAFAEEYTYVEQKSTMKDFINNFDGTPQELKEALNYACENVQTGFVFPEHPKAQFGFSYPEFKVANYRYWQTMHCYYVDWKPSTFYTRDLWTWNVVTRQIGDSYAYRVYGGTSTSWNPCYDEFDNKYDNGSYEYAYPLPVVVEEPVCQPTVWPRFWWW